MQIKALLSVVFLSRVGTFLLFPYLAIYLSERNFSPSKIGILLGVCTLTMAFFGPFIGYFSDKCDRSLNLFFSLIVISLVFVLLAQVSSFLLLVIGLVVIGGLRANIEITINALLSHFSLNSNRESLFRLKYGITNVAAILGLAIGWAMIKELKFNIFHLAAFFYLFSTSFILYFKETFLGDYVTKKEINNYENEKPNYTFLTLMTGAMFLMLFLHSQLDSIFPQVLKEKIQSGVDFYGILLIVNAIIVALLQIWGRNFWANFDEMSIYLGSGVAIVTGTYLLWSTHQLSLLFVSIILYSIGEMLIFPKVLFVISNQAPRYQLGFYFGLTNIGLLGQALGPIFGGFLLESTTEQFVPEIFSLVAFLGVLFVFFAHLLK